MRSTPTTRACSPRPLRWQTSTSPLRMEERRGLVQARGQPGVLCPDPRAEGLEQTGQHRAVAAQRRRLATGEEPGELVAAVVRGLGVALLGQPVTGAQAQTLRRGIRLHGGAAAHRRRADDPGHAVGAQHGGDAGGLGPAHGVERALPVIALPLAAGGGLGVAHERERPGVELAGPLGPHEGEQLLTVAGVVEPDVGRAHVDPGDLVDLVQQLARAAGHDGRPVVHDLRRRGTGRIEDGVLRQRERRAQPHDETGLLEGLAGGRDAGVLTGVELALGPRPVVVLRPVHEGDLQPTVAMAPRERAGGWDEGGHGRQCAACARSGGGGHAARPGFVQRPGRRR